MNGRLPDSPAAISHTCLCCITHCTTPVNAFVLRSTHTRSVTMTGMKYACMDYKTHMPIVLLCPPSVHCASQLHFEAERSEALLVLLDEFSAVFLSALHHTRVARGAGLGAGTAYLEAGWGRGGRAGGGHAGESGGR